MLFTHAVPSVTERLLSRNRAAWRPMIEGACYAAAEEPPAMVSNAPERIRPLRRVEYDQLVALGAFEKERIELINGALRPMRPIGPPHASTVARRPPSRASFCGAPHPRGGRRLAALRPRREGDAVRRVRHTRLLGRQLARTRRRSLSQPCGWRLSPAHDPTEGSATSSSSRSPTSSLRSTISCADSNPPRLTRLKVGRSMGLARVESPRCSGREWS
jgi:hypothetical protein